MTTNYGAGANTTGSPVGGGVGYLNIISPAQADYIVNTRTELINALSAATTGQIVYVNDSSTIDLSGLSDIIIKPGVTLASGRGSGGSNGALIQVSPNYYPAPLFSAGGPNVRVTGLRLYGSFEGITDVPNSRAIATTYDSLEVDNNEIWGWSYSGVYVMPGGTNSHIHHNYIHHVQKAGYGYGISLGLSTQSQPTSSLIEANIFHHNRHSIAATGNQYGSYEARYNIVLTSEPYSYASFDRHGNDPQSTMRGHAGDWTIIHHNTFVETVNHGVLIRGEPYEGAIINNNWFYDSDISGAICLYLLNDSSYCRTSAPKVEVFDNWYGTSPPPEIAGGSLNVSSTPSGAEIFIDNVDQLVTTNGTINNIPAGTHTLKLTLSGYQDYTQSFSITEGQTTTVSATLTQIPCPDITSATITGPSSVVQGTDITVNVSWTGGLSPYSVDYTIDSSYIESQSNITTTSTSHNLTANWSIGAHTLSANVYFVCPDGITYKWLVTNTININVTSTVTCPAITSCSLELVSQSLNTSWNGGIAPYKADLYIDYNFITQITTNSTLVTFTVPSNLYVGSHSAFVKVWYACSDGTYPQCSTNIVTISIPEPIPTGLLAHWKFDEASGTTVSDSAGNYPGIIYNATWTTGRINSALSFNGTNSYVDFGTGLNLTTPFTITMWVRRNATSGWRALIVKGENANSQYNNYYAAFSSTGIIYFSIGSGTAYRYFQTSNALDTNWHHLAFVYNSSTDMRIYVDSVVQAGTYSGTATAPAANTNKLLIGATTTTQEIFNGIIDDTKIFNYAMTSAQVLSEYQLTTCPEITANLTIV